MQVSTSAPLKLARTQPLVGPEMIERKPVVPVLLEPVIECTAGCSDAGRSTWPHSGPHPSVYESDASQEPV